MLQVENRDSGECENRLAKQHERPAIPTPCEGNQPNPDCNVGWPWQSASNGRQPENAPEQVTGKQSAHAKKLLLAIPNVTRDETAREARIGLTSQATLYSPLRSPFVSANTILQ